MTTPNAIERLATLSAQRTVRTDRLATAVHALLEQIEPHVEYGTRVTVRGYTLTHFKSRTNVGQYSGWTLSTRGDDEWHTETCNLDRGVNSEGYVHGDFHHPRIGPTRAQLLAFGERAQEFVAAITAAAERDCDSAESAEIAVVTARISAA